MTVLQAAIVVKNAIEGLKVCKSSMAFVRAALFQLIRLGFGQPNRIVYKKDHKMINLA